MAEMLTALGLVLTVLVAYLQIQKNQRAALALQETHLKNELKVKLYERFSAILDEASNDLSKASVQYYSVISLLSARIRQHLPVALTETGLELSQQVDSTQRRLSRVLNVLEEYEVVFTRFRTFRRQLAADHSQLLATHGALWAKILIYLPFIHTDSGKKVGPVVLPNESDLVEIEGLHAAYREACSEISGHFIDLQIEVQNELLGALFQRQLPPRHPADPSIAVLKRDESELVERPRGSLI